MLKTIIKKVFGTKQDRELKRIRPIVARINDLESKIEVLDDAKLKARTGAFRRRLEKGQPIDELLPEAFAVVREVGKRTLGMRHYDVQMVGGVALHEGKVTEMKTGEGKTLVATSPMYLNALMGGGAHLVTVNDYLADRDADWMGTIYRFLGLSVGKIISNVSNEERRQAYAADITYGTNNEFGFDYLRDNMKFRLEDYVQRPHAYAIVDEVDSILIDEARTPLIISGQIEQDLSAYFEINKLIPFLKKDEDYTLDEKAHSVALTEEGIERVEEHLEVDNIYEPRNIEYLHHVNKALQAHTLYKKDQNYVVADNKVVIVDEFTGRLMPGRRWSDGLHQAVEAKEGVNIQNETRVLATITFQNYFRMYDKLAGMTGTADTEAEEFKKTYELETLVIPTNRPIARLDHPDVIYRSERDKIGAIIDQIAECNGKGQPILVGTVSVEKSEVISKVLRRKNIEHSVLNAKNHGFEAEFVAQAGRRGAVTIATNMAGRGTDIMLGGNPEFLARKAAEAEGLEDPTALEDEYRERCAKEKQQVLDAGGLFILGTERHESRRIDNQLRGRSGRQGDPGGSRFFLSLEDDLMRIFGAERIGGLMDRLGMEPGVPIEHKMVTKAIENAQRRVEGRNFDIRKNLLEYDDVMNAQRKAIYGLRQRILEGRNIRELILDTIEDVLIALGGSHLPEGVMPEDWDVDAVLSNLKDMTQRDYVATDAFVRGGARQRVLEELWLQAEAAYNEREKEFIDAIQERTPGETPERPGNEILENIAQRFFLREIDNHWRDHLSTMSALRDAISLRGYAQKDPKQEYKREGYDLFVEMLTRTKANLITQLFQVSVPREELPQQSLAPVAKQVTRMSTNRAPELTAEDKAQAAASAAALKEALERSIAARNAAKRAAGRIVEDDVPAPEAKADKEEPPAAETSSKAKSADPEEVKAAAKPEKPKKKKTRNRKAKKKRTSASSSSSSSSASSTKTASKSAKSTEPETSSSESADDKVGRNDPCWCGSGKKYKQCHFEKDQERAATT